MTIKAASSLFALSIALLLVSSSHAEDWADEASGLTSAPAYARSKALCRSVRSLRPAEGDRVSVSEAAKMGGCDAQTLYYGDHGAPDYVKAHQCVMAKTKNGQVDTDEVFGGFTILMQLYANGLGVARNLDLAIHYACNLDGAPAEMQGRIEHLAQLKSRPQSKSFDFCNDITSGLAEGYCSGRDARKADVRRQASLDALLGRVDPTARGSFTALRQAAYDYAKVHATKEVDLTGSARDTFVDEAETAARNAFVTLARQTLTAAGPSATPAEAKAADGRLNMSWRRLKARGPRMQPDGTVVFSDVLAAQRSWIRYRDAFLSFSRAQWPSRPTDGLVRRLALERADVLDDLVSD